MESVRDIARGSKACAAYMYQFSMLSNQLVPAWVREMGSEQVSHLLHFCNEVQLYCQKHELMYYLFFQVFVYGKVSV